MIEDDAKVADQSPDPDSETPPESDKTAAPVETEETKQAEPSEEEVRFTQAAFTKLTQDYASRFRSLEEKIEQAFASPGRAKVEEEPQEELPQVEKVVRGTRAFRELAEQNKTLQRTLAAVSEVALTQALTGQFPELRQDMPKFLEWVRAVPGRASMIQAGALSDVAIVAAYRAENPGSKRTSGNGNRPTPKPVPKVESSSAPRGTLRDIREKVREKTGKTTGRLSIDDAFDTAVTEARREVKIAEE